MSLRRLIHARALGRVTAEPWALAAPGHDPSMWRLDEKLGPDARRFCVWIEMRPPPWAWRPRSQVGVDEDQNS